MQITVSEDEFQDGDNRVLSQAMGTLRRGPCELHVTHRQLACLMITCSDIERLDLWP